MSRDRRVQKFRSGEVMNAAPPTRPGADLARTKQVGRRRTDADPLQDQGRLARTAAALRGAGFAPGGVYRFATFEEAEAWMNSMMRRSHERRRRKTSHESATR